MKWRGFMARLGYVHWDEFNHAKEVWRKTANDAHEKARHARQELHQRHEHIVLHLQRDESMPSDDCPECLRYRNEAVAAMGVRFRLC